MYFSSQLRRLYLTLDLVKCDIFTGLSGKLVLFTLTSGAFLCYVGLFALRRNRILCCGGEHRSWRVFWLDLLKMGAGQVIAWVINVVNSHRNAGETEFGAVSWYMPTFLNDELIGVPLGVLLWHQVVVRGACILSQRWPRGVWIEALQASGRYYPDADDVEGLPVAALVPAEAASCTQRADRGVSCGVWGDAGEPAARIDWWAIQLVLWMACVSCSRLLGGTLVPLLHHAL